MNNFVPIPAIDILAGNCVRLIKGDFDQVTQYSSKPVNQAEIFAKAGAKRIHIVDLDGAKTGVPENFKFVSEITKMLSAKYPDTQVQIGGGIRNLDTIKKSVNAGVSFVVLGTAAINDRKFLEEACNKYPEKIMLGLDVRDQKIAVKGWKETTDIDLVEFATNAQDIGIAGIICTDINRDGLLEGPNIELTSNLATKVTCPVIASGGIHNIKDIVKLRNTKVAGAIIGKAIYSNKIALDELFSV